MWSRRPARVSGVIGGVKYVASRTAVVSNKTTKPASSKTTIGHEGRIATRRGRLSTLSEFVFQLLSGFVVQYIIVYARMS